MITASIKRQKEERVTDEKCTLINWDRPYTDSCSLCSSLEFYNKRLRSVSPRSPFPHSSRFLPLTCLINCQPKPFALLYFMEEWILKYRKEEKKKVPRPRKDTPHLTGLSVDDKIVLAKYWKEVIGACTCRESNRCSYIMYTELLILCRISMGAEVEGGALKPQFLLIHWNSKSGWNISLVDLM